jgi:hypothetical protein
MVSQHENGVKVEQVLVSGRTTKPYRIGTGGLGNGKCGNSLTEETIGGIRIRNKKKNNLFSVSRC